LVHAISRNRHPKLGPVREIIKFEPSKPQKEMAGEGWAHSFAHPE
jgi:hypothetical protein